MLHSRSRQVAARKDTPLEANFSTLAMTNALGRLDSRRTVAHGRTKLPGFGALLAGDIESLLITGLGLTNRAGITSSLQQFTPHSIPTNPGWERN